MKFESDRPEAEIVSSLTSIFESSTVMTLGTVFQGALPAPWINNSFFAFDNSFDVYFVSAPDSVHSLNVEANGQSAVSIFDPTSLSAGEKLAVQMTGVTAPLGEGDVMDGVKIYADRFERFGTIVGSPEDLRRTNMWVYRFTIEDMKLNDERRFGKENRVAARRVTTTAA
jgi:uncharacterized protein YhbP (UPF0306 family)